MRPRHPRPGVGLGVGNSSSTSVARNILTVLWIGLLLLPGLAAGGSSAERSSSPSASPSENAVAGGSGGSVSAFAKRSMETLSIVTNKAGRSVGVINVAFGGGKGGKGDGGVGSFGGHGIQRDISEYVLEDFVILATLDGHLTARDRQTGEWRWEITTDQPSVQSRFHGERKVKRVGREGEVEEREVMEEKVEWMLSPTEDGELYFYSPEDKGKLQKLGITLKNIVHDMPHRPPGLDTVYNGSKNSTVYNINAATGEIVNVFGAGGWDRQPAGCDPKKQPDGSCPKIVTVGMTRYTLTIHNSRTGKLLWSFAYNEWTPNYSDVDLRRKHVRPMDNRYIFGRHDGYAFGIEAMPDGGSGGATAPKYNIKLESPITRIFDVVRYNGDLEVLQKDKNNLLILPQPSYRLPKDAGDSREGRTFVGYTEHGSFAMSEEDFPYITNNAPSAKCYDRTQDWEQLSENERRQLLVGIHHTDPNQRIHPNLLSLPAPSMGIDSNTGGLRNQRYSSPWIPGQKGLSSGTEKESMNVGGMVMMTLLAIMSVAAVMVGKFGGLDRWKPLGHKLAEPVREFLPMMKGLPQLQIQSKEAVNALMDKPLPSLPEVERDIVDEFDIITPVVEEAPKVRFVEEPDVVEVEKLEEPKDEDGAETAANKPAVSFPKTPEELPPATPEKKPKRKRGSRGGVKNKPKGSAKTSDANTSNLEVGEKTDLEKDDGSVKLVIHHKVKGGVPGTTVISSGNVEEGVNGPKFVLNKLEVHEDDLLGHGSHGTSVYGGFWEGKAVAVKRIITTHAELAEKEIATLQETDYHTNVIRYYCQQQSGPFLYIALERCPGTLDDLIQRPDKFSPSLRNIYDPQDALLQITNGIHHLHDLKIVHRDIKPQNILVGEPQGKSGRPRFLISDFGLCRKLQPDEYSFGATTAHNAGTIGWRARELLSPTHSDLIDLPPPTLPPSPNASTSGSTSGVEMIIDHVTKRRVTRAIDIFSLGCVFYFVLSSGEHPFGDRMAREINILHERYDLSRLDSLSDAGVEARHLIESMISGDPRRRPDTAKIGAHPFFWSNEKRLDFLSTVSNHFDTEATREKNDRDRHAKESRTRPTPPTWTPYFSPYIPILERDAGDILGPQGWEAKLDRTLKMELSLNKRRSYDTTKLLHLLRMIRNKWSHFDDILEEARRKLGGGDEGAFYEYFAGRFEGLCLRVWERVGECGWPEQGGVQVTNGGGRWAKFRRHPFTGT